MSRVARRALGGLIYHVLNRANSRRRLFRTDADYRAFLDVLIEALRRFPGVKLLAFCIMPNHWHLVLEPSADGELSRFMRWLTQTHTQRWRHARNTVGFGALYQGRYKSFVVQEDRHFLVLCRYVERNALRAKLVRRAEDWPWCSAGIPARQDAMPRALWSMLAEWPVACPPRWLALLNEPQGEKEQQRVRVSIVRNRPLGQPGWVERTASRLGLSHTLRPPGRPRRIEEGAGKRKATTIKRTIKRTPSPFSMSR
jgi:putative transposase